MALPDSPKNPLASMGRGCEMKEPVKVAVVAVIALSIAVAAGILAYMERPLPKPGVRYLRIAYTICQMAVPFHESLVEEVIDSFKKWYSTNFGAEVRVDVEFRDMMEFAKEVGRGPPSVDVWWGALHTNFEEKADYLLPYNSTVKQELLNMSCFVNGTYYNCPIMDLEGPAPRWYAWAFYTVCFVYNPDELGRETPRSWAELANPRLENMVIAPDTRNDMFSKYVGLVILASEMWKLGNESLGWGAAWNISTTIWALSEELTMMPGQDFLKIIAGVKAGMVSSDIMAYHFLIDGEYKSLKIAYLNGTLLFPCPVAILKGAKNLKTAKAFVDFLLSSEGQAVVAEHLMPVRPDVEVRPPIANPFSPDFPIIKEFNRTFLELAPQFVYDYHKSWLVIKHGPGELEGTLRNAWWWVKKANETKEANENATRYYRLALGNLSAMGSYLRRCDFDKIYNETDRWTNRTDYINKWINAALSAFKNATRNAQESIRLAKENMTGRAYGSSRGRASSSWRPRLWRKFLTRTGLPSRDDMRAASQRARARRPSLPVTSGSLPSSTHLTKCWSSRRRGSRHSLGRRRSPSLPSKETRWLK